MPTVVVIVVVASFLVIAAVVDWRSRRRGVRSDGRAMSAQLQEHRRDLRARRSMMNLGGHDERRDPYR